LLNYSAFQGFVTQIVFDAQYQNTGSNQEIITQTYQSITPTLADSRHLYKACASFRPYSRGSVAAASFPRQIFYQFSADCRHFRPGTAIDGTGVWC